ncbi:PrgI family protein [Candidatus Saccharibacteria bacterium]|nr:PrgI family protein [Candidatus Saccharibacteria bacterium]
MAQYKVPQDVEADDKLLGPFSFRQLIYLFIAAGLIALAVGLFNLFPLLCVIPLPFILFFLILALPLKKDQPMETYLAAIISFYLKPNKRFWNPGQRDSTITITAPKKIEGPRIRTISEEEASHRLSFLADIVDSEGKSVKGNWAAPIREEYLAEASATPDMFETYKSQALGSRVDSETASKHAEAIEQMRAAIDQAENLSSEAPKNPTISRNYSSQSGPSAFTATSPKTPEKSESIVAPSPEPPKEKSDEPNPAKLAAMQQLANNKDYSIATIAKEAERIKNDKNEVYISLH